MSDNTQAQAEAARNANRPEVLAALLAEIDDADIGALYGDITDHVVNVDGLMLQLEGQEDLDADAIEEVEARLARWFVIADIFQAMGAPGFVDALRGAVGGAA